MANRIRELELTELLRCPTCDAEIDLVADEAACRSGHRFPLVEGVVVLVADETLAHDPQYEHQRRYFDAEFAQYAGYAPEHWRTSYFRRLLAAGVIAPRGGPVLDVGVGGSGHTVIEAARDGSPSIGCDLSLAGLVTARRFAVDEGVADRTLWVCCSAEKLPLANASVASALAIAVLEHVPDDRAALAEIARVLRPGGRAWVTVPHALENISPLFRIPNRRHDRKLGHLRRYDADGLRDAGRAVGLNVEDVQFTGHPIKVVQLVGVRLLGDRFWWWCERRDLRRAHDPRGSMQLSVVFERAA